MSVILDALRRRRTDSRAASATDHRRARPIPAGLGLGVTASDPAPSGRRRRWAVVVAALLLVSVAAVLYLSPWSPARVSPPAAGTVAAGGSAPPSRTGLPAERPPTRTPEAPPESPPAPASLPAAAAPTAGAVTRSEFDSAVRDHNLGRFEQALEHYRKALVADEFNVQARNNLGLLYYEHQRPDDAIAELRHATRLRPDYVKARSNLAVVLTSVGRFREARAELRAAMDREPRSADLLVNMALVDKADHRVEAATEWLNRALGYEPSHGMAHYNLGVLYDEAGLAALADEHYAAFLEVARPEQRALMTEVERRLQSPSPAPLPSLR